MAAPAEQMLLRAHPSRLFSFGYYLAAGFLVLVALGLFLNDLLRFFTIPRPQVGPLSLVVWLILVAVVFAVLLVVVAEIRRVATTYTVTDTRVIRRQGIANITTDTVPYRQVERVELRQSLLQRIAGVGTVAVDTGEDLLLIEHVPKPDTFERTISQRIATYR